MSPSFAALKVCVEVVLLRLAADADPHVVGDAVCSLSGKHTLQVGHLLCFLFISRRILRSLEVVFLVRHKHKLVVSPLTHLELVHAEGMGQRDLGLTIFENFEEAVLRMHRVLGLGVLRELLVVNDGAHGRGLNRLKGARLLVGYLLVVYEDRAFAAPGSFQKHK